jgi:hypothetical protein
MGREIQEYQGIEIILKLPTFIYYEDKEELVAEQ